MRNYGIRRYKGSDFEIELERHSEAKTELPLGGPALAQAPPKDSDPVSDINSLLKLDDMKLIDRLFPEPQEDESA